MFYITIGIPILFTSETARTANTVFEIKAYRQKSAPVENLNYQVKEISARFTRPSLTFDFFRDARSWKLVSSFLQC
jgi:hypothetical protein